MNRVRYANEWIGPDELTGAGVVLAAAIVAFTARVVCEQTLVTWAHGGQEMELCMPQFGLDLIGMLCIILGIIWALTVVVLSLTGRGRLSATNRWLIAILLACCGLWLVPYEEWKLLLVRAHDAEHTPKN